MCSSSVGLHSRPVPVWRPRDVRGARGHQPGAGQSWASRQGPRVSGTPPLATLPLCRRCPGLSASGTSHRRLVLGLDRLEVPTRVGVRGSSSLQTPATSERSLRPASHSEQQIDPGVGV